MKLNCAVGGRQSEGSCSGSVRNILLGIEEVRRLVGSKHNAIHAISFEQAYRVLMEPKTRDQLNGRFLHEWLDDVAQYRYGLWNDGDKFFTSYVGHQLQGAVVEGIFWQNDDRVRFLDQDFHSAAYRKALLQAFAFAAVDAVQWKLGPVSEASIGHVGLPAHWWDTPYFCNLMHAYCHPRTGLNDLILNEVGGTAMVIGFQWVDKHFQKPMENRIQSRALMDTMRIFTNPPQSLANFFRFRALGTETTAPRCSFAQGTLTVPSIRSWHLIKALWKTMPEPKPRRRMV